MARVEARTHQAKVRFRRVAYRPAIEFVEARVLLTNYTVTTTSDSGPGTLRQAITLANANPGPDTISFQFSAVNTPGLVDYDPIFQNWRIQVASPLPTITDLLSIDGYTQRVLTGKSASNEVESITINGSPVGGTFTLTVGGQTTAPIAYDATADQVGTALEALSNIGAGNVLAAGGPANSSSITVEFVNQLSLTNVGQITGDASGLIPSASGTPTIVTSITAQANSGDITSDPNTLAIGFGGKPRVILDGSLLDPSLNAAGLTIQSDHNRIRGLVIDGFSTGIAVQGSSAIGNLIQGNYVGQYLAYYNPTYLVSTPVVQGIGNGVGVLIASPTNNSVGGVSPDTHNAIAGNLNQGVLIDTGATGNQVVGNLIGVLQDSATVYAQIGNGAEGVLVRSSSNAIGGAVIGSTNVISANGTYGIHIVGVDAVRNRIQANYIGTDPTGSFTFGQGNPGNGQNMPAQMGNLRDGIFIDNAPNNQIGITGASIASHSGGPPANVISGNFGAGIRISGASATGNIVLGNYIGTDLTGASALPNFQEGVAIDSAGNRVGGLNPGDENVISGNRRGVLISGPAATGNLVIGNLIGTNGTSNEPGTYDLGNALEGIRIEDVTSNIPGTSGNTIGGTSAAARNVISGNNVGVAIVITTPPPPGYLALGNSVSGNYIGTDITGKLDLGNSQEGVRIDGASANTIGGAASGAGNLISANHWGVVITGPAATTNRIQANLIGTDVSGTLPVGNEVDGVLINNSAANNLIGGLGIGSGNTIAFNILDGVRVESVGSIGNSILSNGIFSNVGLGIHLVPPVPPVGPGVGPNILLPAPTLSLVTSTSSGVIVTGNYAGTPGSSYTLQFFSSAVADPSGSGEGETFLGTTTFRMNATGDFTATLPVSVTGGQFVTATATDAAGNTSEFSGPVAEVVSPIEFSMRDYTASEGDGVAIITLVRVGGSGGFATVNYKVSNGTAKLGFTPSPNANYTVPAGATPEPTQPGVLPTYYTATLVFNAGEFVKTFAIPLLDDNFPGPDKTVNLTLLNATGAATIGDPPTATLLIKDNDLPGVITFSSSSYVVNEAQGSITVTVLRDSPGLPVSVNYATSGGTATPGVRYTPVSGTLYFAQNQTAATFTIPINDDSVIQGDQTVGLILSNPSNGASLGTPNTATLTIEDDLRDRSGPTVQSVRLLKRGAGLTYALVVTYDRPIDPSTAIDLVNYGYSVRTAGRDHRFGTRDDLIIPIVNAVYDTSNRTATLTLGRGIHPPTPFQFQINESTSVAGAGVGVAGLKGNLLDGNYDGVAGSPFSIVLRGKSGGFTASTEITTGAEVGHLSKKKRVVIARRPHASSPAAPKVIHSARGSRSHPRGPRG